MKKFDKKRVKCLKCGKTLTDAHSIEVGLGKTCESKISIAFK